MILPGGGGGCKGVLVVGSGGSRATFIFVRGQCTGIRGISRSVGTGSIQREQPENREGQCVVQNSSFLGTYLMWRAHTGNADG